MSKRVFTPNQIDLLMTEVATSCERIALLAKRISAGFDDAETTEVMGAAINCMASRAGWFADLARTGTEGGLYGLTDGVLSESIAWLMPEPCIPERTQTLEESA